MIEAEWLACTDPTPMLEFLQHQANDRKLRLFACACARRIWERIGPPLPVEIDISERFADGGSDKQEMDDQWERVVVPERPRSAWAAAAARQWLVDTTEVTSLREIAESVAEFALQFLMFLAEERHGFNAIRPDTDAQRAIVDAARQAEEVEQVVLLRDIFGNPFRPLAVEPSWLAWSDGTVVKLAQGIYDERAFDRLPVLADALEDAGCHDGDILNHCRRPGQHVRGCWVVDLLTGRS